MSIDKIGGIDNIFNKYEQFGTYFGKQVLCQFQRICYKISAWYAPFMMIKGCYYLKRVYHVDNQQVNLFVNNIIWLSAI